MILIFIFGLCVGSFLNVLIDRLPKEEQVIKGRSYCDFCHRQLKWFDLIPILSFLCLAGRCHYCHKKISFYYPLVELITGILFVLTFKFFPVPSFYPLLIIISCLIVIFFADLKYTIIPDEMIIIAIIATVLHIFISSYLPAGRHVFISSLLTGLLSSGFFLLLRLITAGRGMGLGDVKLAFLIGFLLGWPKIIIAFYLAFLTGAVIGVILILLGKKRFGQTIPFGPFLIIGVLTAMFYGEKIINWWLRIL